MAEPPRQIPLDLPIVERLGRDDFVVGEANRAAVELVERWPDWPSDVVVLIGPEGAGKSHLAGLFAERSGATIVAAADLAGCDPLALAAAGDVVVEDADGDGDGDERALFHLVNAVRQAGRHLMITAREAPAAWPTRLPDLASRLRAATPVALGLPDDALIEALLAKHFADRQTVVDPGVVAYLARRTERSFAGTRRLVAALDRAALAAKGPITRALAARILDEDLTFARGQERLDECDEDENNPSHIGSM